VLQSALVCRWVPSPLYCRPAALFSQYFITAPLADNQSRRTADIYGGDLYDEMKS
jgi:hypothetical protein